MRLFDTDARATDKVVASLRRSAIRVLRCSSVADAVRGADIVTTVTADKTNATIVTPEMVEPGMHFSAVGGDCPGKTELHADPKNLLDLVDRLAQGQAIAAVAGPVVDEAMV